MSQTKKSALKLSAAAAEVLLHAEGQLWPEEVRALRQVQEIAERLSR